MPERLYRSPGLIFLYRWREVFNLYLSNIPVKFGKIQSIVPEEEYSEGKVYGRADREMDTQWTQRHDIIARWSSANGVKKLWWKKFQNELLAVKKLYEGCHVFLVVNYHCLCFLVHEPGIMCCMHFWIFIQQNSYIVTNVFIYIKPFPLIWTLNHETNVAEA